ncbi:MAG TPA: hypothetical protein VFA20_05155 [Myxococcaceae bacterium]|nr:hypothetical protein [Myxococcaceae bacterium]
MGDPLVDRLRLKFPALGRTLEGREHLAAREALPFYRRHSLVTLTIQLRVPLVYPYLDDGVDLAELNGTFRPLAAANARERLQLVPQHAEAYARFALQHGMGARVVERPEQIDWHHEADAEAKGKAVLALRPLRLVISPEGGFEVTAVLHHQQDLVEARWRLALDGGMHELGTRTVAERIPMARPPV